MNTTVDVAMTDADDDRIGILSSADVARYAALLRDRRGEQLTRLAHLARQDPDAVDDHAEIAERLAREELSEVESALARLETGTYGRCEACGDAVPPLRLEAIPHVRTCVACASCSPMMSGPSPS